MSETCLKERSQDKAEIESGSGFQPKFDANGLIPCITTDFRNNEVLMFAYMNREALEKTISTGEVTYYSRSRQSLWVKGESSGQTQCVKELRTDCDQDVILVKADIGIDGAACHTGHRSCFYRKLDPDAGTLTTEGKPLFDPKAVYGK